MRKCSIWMALVMLVILMGLVTCKPREIELHFETLVHHKGYCGATYKNMDLLIATNPDEAQEIVNTLSPAPPTERCEEIASVNYQEYFVVVAYFGTRVYSESAITIERITQTGDTVDVTISTVEPIAGDRVIVHPIHIVKIDRDDLLANGFLTFRLWKGNEAILTREYFIS